MMKTVTINIWTMPDVGGPGFAFEVEGDYFGLYEGRVLRPFDSLEHLVEYVSTDGYWGSPNDFSGKDDDWEFHSSINVEREFID